MTNKDFWRNSTVAVLGSGSFGTVLSNMIAQNVNEIRMFVREEEQARAINATKTNAAYFDEMTLSPKIVAVSDLNRLFETPPDVVVWVLPSGAVRHTAKKVAGMLTGKEIFIHATKGIEESTHVTMSEVLRQETPIVKIGAISGPNLAKEIAAGQPASTVIASKFEEVIDAGKEILGSKNLRVVCSNDLVGIEWAGILKNIYAIVSGMLEAKGYGYNVKAMMISQGLSEMVNFAMSRGARPEVFVSVAGIGDLFATCSSDLSRNFRVGMQLASGMPINQILSDLGQVAEGVKTANVVVQMAREDGISMPIAETLVHILTGQITANEGLDSLLLN